MCISVLDFYMEIINNKHTLLYNLSTTHFIQRYKGLCELTNYFESCIGFVLLNCVNEKNIHMFSYVFKKQFVLSNCLNAKKKKKKNTFGMRNTQYSIALSVHKQTSIFNTTNTIQSLVNCPRLSDMLRCNPQQRAVKNN